MSSTARNVQQLQPTTVTYREHVIKLIHRPKTNDWKYSFKHTRTLHVSNQFARYDTALQNARSDIDNLLGDER